MTEVILYYVIPNIIMFGSLYFIAKAIEFVTSQVIEYTIDENGTSMISKWLDKI